MLLWFLIYSILYSHSVRLDSRSLLISKLIESAISFGYLLAIFWITFVSFKNQKIPNVRKRNKISIDKLALDIFWETLFYFFYFSSWLIPCTKYFIYEINRLRAVKNKNKFYFFSYHLVTLISFDNFCVKLTKSY